MSIGNRLIGTALAVLAILGMGAILQQIHGVLTRARPTHWQSQAAARRADHQRAQRAGLEGRGYSLN